MDINVKTLADGVVIVQLGGRLNMVSAAQLRDRVSALVGEGLTRIAVDLARVEFIDSSGLGALIGGLKTARQAGGDLRIARPTEQAELVLQLTNLDRVLVTYPSAESAFSA